MVLTIAIALSKVLINLIAKHPKSKHQNIWILNSYVRSVFKPPLYLDPHGVWQTCGVSWGGGGRGLGMISVNSSFSSSSLTAPMKSYENILFFLQNTFFFLQNIGNFEISKQHKVGIWKYSRDWNTEHIWNLNGRCQGMQIQHIPLHNWSWVKPAHP